MATYQLGAKEALFAAIIWENEPVPSGRLAKIAEEQLGWKITTTYTVLKHLCNKGIFQNQKSIVTSCMTYDEFLSGRSEKLVNESYQGSLPAFVAAFLRKKSLTAAEAEELHRLVDNAVICDEAAE